LFLATHEGDREVLDALRVSFSLDGEHFLLHLIFFQFPVSVLELVGFLEVTFGVLSRLVETAVFFVTVGREAFGDVDS
jgi:hypothetical protein